MIWLKTFSAATALLIPTIPLLNNGIPKWEDYTLAGYQTFENIDIIFPTN